VVGNILYAAGIEQLASGDSQAYVARVRAEAPGEVLAVWRWNPSTLFDAALGLATDGQTLYAACATEHDFDTGVARPRLVALPLDFTSSSDPLWMAEPGGMLGAWDVALDPTDSDGLYVVGEGTPEGWVGRCTRSGDCAP